LRISATHTGGGGPGMPPGMMGGMMFAGMDPEDIGSEEEEEILQEFMMAHSEQVGKIK